MTIDMAAFKFKKVIYVHTEFLKSYPIFCLEIWPKIPER